MIGMIVDLFAGGGGASTGIEAAMGRKVDIAINHSDQALMVHALNHDGTHHMIEDLIDVPPLIATNGQPVDVLWASPDCRHFSRAKGGKPAHPKVRALPWTVVRWARDVKPVVIGMENVPEFQSWGPLGLDSRPVAERKGETFRAWVQALRDLGYHVDWRVLCAADYGAPTTRRRLFLVARLDAPVEWPEPTHGPGRPKPYRTAAECIDWSDLGTSIFERKRPLADATCRRIARGLVKYVLDAKRPFMVPETDASSYLIQTGYGERKGQKPRICDINKPLGTVVAGGSKHALVTAWIAKHYGGVTGHGLRRPLGTVTTVDHHSLCTAHTGPGKHATRVAAFLTTYYGTRTDGQRVDEPLATITTKDRHGLVCVVIDGEEHVITDIRMRMLQPNELKLAQGFPADYDLGGDATTKRLKVKLIGNSVPPQLSEAVIAANTKRLRAAA